MNAVCELLGINGPTDFVTTFSKQDIQDNLSALHDALLRARSVMNFRVQAGVKSTGPELALVRSMLKSLFKTLYGTSVTVDPARDSYGNHNSVYRLVASRE